VIIESAIFGGVFLSIALTAYGFRNNSIRLLKKYSFSLLPNCLLTRHPIVFVSGKQSLFYHGRYWNFIPSYLQEHGYEILALDMPWRDSKKRILEISNFADALIHEGTPAHWICDASSADELQSTAQEKALAFKSIRIVTNEALPKNSWKDFNLFIHNLLWSPIQPQVVGVVHDDIELKEIGKMYLKIAVELAEQDYLEDAPYDRSSETHSQI
jgi:hypothetical protein